MESLCSQRYGAMSIVKDTRPSIFNPYVVLSYIKPRAAVASSQMQCLDQLPVSLSEKSLQILGSVVEHESARIRITAIFR